MNRNFFIVLALQLVVILDVYASPTGLLTKQYPISREAVRLILQSCDLQRKDEGAHPSAPSSVFFKRYGIKMGDPNGSMLAYDGQALMIIASQEDHEKISLVLQIVEDMASAAQAVYQKEHTEPRRGASAPPASQANQ